ncbi:MAG: serine kinase [Bryobacteraceae bacterium]|jgi:hypothetical protein
MGWPAEAEPSAASAGGAPEEFFTAVRRRFEAAAERAGVIERRFQIGDRVALLRFAGAALEELLTPALAHIPAPAEAEPELTICLFDTRSTGVAPPPPPWGADAYGVRGEIAGFNTTRLRTVYQPGSDILLMLDHQRGEAFYWISDDRKVPYWERSFPLRTIFHWWFEKLPLQPVHAAAVGLSSGGVLITGASGSGKSTAALACLDSDLQFAGDDYVLVRHGPEPHVYSLYGTAKVEVENLARFPRLRAAVSNESRLDTEKALVFVSRFAPGKLIGGFPIRALLVSRITGRQDTVLRRATSAEGFRALAPTTLSHLPGAEREAFRKLSALVREVPVYTLEAGTDLPQIPRRILEFLSHPEAV